MWFSRQYDLKHMRRFASSAKPREIFNARREGLAKFPAKNQAVGFWPSDCRIKHPARRPIFYYFFGIAGTMPPRLLICFKSYCLRPHLLALGYGSVFFEKTAQAVFCLQNYHGYATFILVLLTRLRQKRWAVSLQLLNVFVEKNL